MSGYGMNDEDWNEFKDIAIAFLASNNIGEMKQVIEWNIATGDDDTENRKRYQTSMFTLFGMLPNSPFPQLDDDECCNVELSDQCSENIVYKGDEKYGGHTKICDNCFAYVEGRGLECTIKIADECIDESGDATIEYIGWQNDKFVLVCAECEQEDQYNYMENKVQDPIQVDEPQGSELVIDSSCIICSGGIDYQYQIDASVGGIFVCEDCGKEHQFCGTCANYYSNDDIKCPRDH